MSTGLTVGSVVRSKPRAESYLQSIVPYPITPIGPQDPTDLRFSPLETRDVIINLDPTAIFRQVYYRFQLENEYAGPALAGSLSRASGTPTVTGAGTSFRNDFLIGDIVWYVTSSNKVAYTTVKAIVSETTMTVADSQGLAAASSSYGKALARNIPAAYGGDWGGDWIADMVQTAGTISATTVSSNLVGVGTAFLTQLVPGEKIRVPADDGSIQYLIVNTITSNIAATVRGFPAVAITGKAYVTFYTRYSDLTFNIFTAAGLWLGQTNVQANQGAFGSVDLLHGLDGVAHTPYFYGRSDAIVLRIQNTQNDARRVHGHVGAVRILT